MEEEKAPLSVYDIIVFMVEQMQAVSWQKLGLQHDPMTGKLEANLTEARVAIDTTAFLVQQLESRLDDEDKRRLQSIVRDLRINFVQRNTDAGVEAEA
jgi:hypothetical protein